MSAFGGKADIDAHPRSHMIERAPADRQYGGGNEGGFAMATLRPTATTVFDSILFRDAFGTPRMREIFSDHALISRYVEVEIALARAQARCDVIPAEAAEQIARNRMLHRSTSTFYARRQTSSVIPFFPWCTSS